MERLMLEALWSAVGGASAQLDAIDLTGPSAVLPSVYDVTGFAAATVAAATLAAAEFRSARTGETPAPVRVDRRAAAGAFVSEQLFTPEGWERPPAWDPIAGVYRTADGWIRLHTNYAYHRAAAEGVLGATDRDGVRAAVAAWAGPDLESAVVAAGGCAAVRHDRDAWTATPAGAAGAAEPLLRRDLAPPVGDRLPGGPVTRPYDGLRVLDLTRVIAGPVCTRVLAAYGADVLRIDPPGFAEVEALLPEMTVGKRTAALDLHDPAGRTTFADLVRDAHVVVTGLRADALERLGFGPAALRALNPGLVTVALNAYGWAGPWRDRRGFDSLVQMSCGIAAAGAAAIGRDEPFPLPAQALDHGTGYLLAAAIGRALTEGVPTEIRGSLIGTANLLMAHPSPVPIGSLSRPDRDAFATVPTATAWGPARRVPFPGTIEGIPNDWTLAAGPLGRSAPVWRV